MKEGVACYQDYLRGLLDLTDNRVGDAHRAAASGDGATIPTIRISSSPPTRARRPSPTTPTPSAANTASGWATRSRPAARWATTTRRWASRRAARGSRSSATSARWASTRRRPISPSSASATCRATCSATACCCRGTSGCVAAFDHRHIFLDPNPDPATSFAERERLFKLPRSSWADYDATLISTGGGVHRAQREDRSRSRPRCKAALAITADTLTPTELVNAILKAPVDLHLQRRHRHLRQGRRARRTRRSAIAPTMRCASTAANCAARSSSKAATSAARSSGASNTRWRAAASTPMRSTIPRASTRSDHEVNIKILLGLADRRRRADRKAAQRAARRNDRRGRGAGVARQLFPDAGAVGHRAHRAAAARRAGSASCSSSRRPDGLNRAIEFLPSDEEHRRAARARPGPHRVPSAPCCSLTARSGSTTSSSPPRCPTIRGSRRRSSGTSRARSPNATRRTSPRHPLKREIIATHVTNSMVNRVGQHVRSPAAARSTGARPHEVVRAYLLRARDFRVRLAVAGDRGARQQGRRCACSRRC